jgi:hypothetical protein
MADFIRSFLFLLGIAVVFGTLASLGFGGSY